MYVIGVDSKADTVETLENMLQTLDPGGEHRFYTDPAKVLGELDQPVEVAFIEVELPEISGIELAKRIIKRYPLCNIIFLTARTEYAYAAFDLHASGYILKPFSLQKIEQALSHLRYRTPDIGERPLNVRCFGSFEVFVKGDPVYFKRRKSKELLAYLIDRRGGALHYGYDDRKRGARKQA